MKKRLLIVTALVLVLAGGVMYKLVLAAPKPAGKEKVQGTLFTLQDPFLINLAGGHYGKVSVALLLSVPPPAPPAGGSTPVELPQQAVVRAVITDALTGVDPQQLVDASARHELLARLVKALDRQTDEPITRVYLTDLTVE